MKRNLSNRAVLANALLLSVLSGCGGGGDSKNESAAESPPSQIEYDLLAEQARASLNTARALARSSTCNESSECVLVKHNASPFACHHFNITLTYSSTSERLPEILHHLENYKTLSRKAVAVEPPTPPETSITCFASTIEIPPSCIAQTCGWPAEGEDPPPP